ncbi:MAG: retroviral-like aspartic protease, partial [Cytophagales bacterium]|nr:retroviral-like aspartic protease [Cytophagales bacterium]
MNNLNFDGCKPFRSPAVNCHFDQKRVVSILDTGAEVSVMSEELYKNLAKSCVKFHKPLDPEKQKKFKMEGATGEKVLPLGLARISLQMERVPCSFVFVIVKNLKKAM